MPQKVNEMIQVLPAAMVEVIRHAVLTGLRPSEAVESVRLLNIRRELLQQNYYYNPEHQTLEHFRSPEIFIRKTKKAFLKE